MEDFSQSISQVLPPHPHRRLHILLAILAIVLVAGSIYFYKLATSQEVVEEIPVVKSDPNELTQNQRAKVLADLQIKASSTPPLTTAERSKILKGIQSNLKKK